MISHAEVGELITIGVAFFDLFAQMQRKAVESFRPAKRIIGRLSANPPMAWTVELSDDGRFGISGNSPGPETNAAYERQEKINSFLDGRVFAAYANSEDALAGMREGLASHGFDPISVALDDAALSNLERQVEEEGLWAPSVSKETTGVDLLATPFGFVKWIGVDCLQSVLPPVEEVEFD